MARILLAEDNAIIGVLLAEILEGLGHTVCAIVAAAAELVSAAAVCRPDLMIVDADLNGESGVLAVQDVLRAGYVPHVFISGGPIRAVPVGAVVLEKPFWDADLTSAMARAMAARPALSPGRIVAVGIVDPPSRPAGRALIKTRGAPASRGVGDPVAAPARAGSPEFSRPPGLVRGGPGTAKDPA
jgi:CheY-like chemotaxis protein